MTAEDRYATPAAFRRALTDRLRTASTEGRWSLPQLQRHVAYDRLVARLYHVHDGWVVKGATALLARDIGVRGSLDVDVYRKVAREVAEADLRRAVMLDLGDWFRIAVGAATVTAHGAVRLPVVAAIGTTTWCQFHVDLLGSDIRMTGRAEDVPPLARGCIPGVDQRGYRVYPLVDHVADKVAAMYARYGDGGLMVSTRYRDLVDLVAIASSASVDAVAQRTALASEFDRRRLVLPDRFDVPDRRLWAPGYAAEAKRSILVLGRSLDAALERVRAFVDPVLNGSATGSWRPAEGVGTWIAL